MRSSASRGFAAGLHSLARFCPGIQSRFRSVGALACALLIFTGIVAAAQKGAQSTREDGVRPIPNHVPAWANEENFIEAVPAGQQVNGLTLVLARHPDRQRAFEKLLADQQDPSSPQYHRWLTSTEIGERFGVSNAELDELTGWLESEGLHVDWVAPARDFIGFSGSAENVGTAFHTELNYYAVNGKRKISIESPPIVPAALAPRIKAITGLYTVRAEPSAHLRAAAPASGRKTWIASPEDSLGDGYYLIGPADFKTIYDVPTDLTGVGITVGIMGRAHTNFADYTAFQNLTGVTFKDPTEVVPTAYGGVDPGPPYKTQQTIETELLADQVEATADVDWISSIAPQAKVTLVVSALYSADDSDGLHDDAQYLVQSKPIPAQVIVVSFHVCEAEAGPSESDFWNGIFSQAAMEGISAFVSSGDGGAAGCDSKFQRPPASPAPISINALCASGYTTCVGGTEFNDASDPSRYWSGSNGAGLLSAMGYIPEGAWNDPYNSSTPPKTEAAASGGGVSEYIATPSWQTGTGVPAARTGRFTPDIAFSASGNNGYVFCLAALGETCTGGSLGLAEGTGADSDVMTGITALLVEKEGKAQGNLMPHLYEMAKSAPTAFHDVTVASSGVSSCSVNTPSLCNNSIPSPTGLTGGQKGYLVDVGYDEVTGLGSLDVGNFFSSYAPFKPPAAATGSASDVTSSAATLTGKVSPNGQMTQYWFLYGTSGSLANAGQSASAEISGSGTLAVSVKIKNLEPGQKYYYRLQSSSVGGDASGAISSFTTKKATQTITFAQPKNPVTTVNLGTTILLSATASSGLPVTFSVTEGHAKLNGDTLKLNTAGTVVVAANQAGGHHDLPAPEVTRKIIVK
jgi:subtilase family serine protease